MAADPYISRFGLVEFIFVVGFSLLIDAFNLVTFFLFAIIINPVWLIVLQLTFSLMKVKNSVSFISFLSPTIYVVATYMLERAKEKSPTLAKIDQAASGVGAMKEVIK